MRPTQRFTDAYLEQSRRASPEATLEFLESFRLMTVSPSPSRLISMKVAEPLLLAFRRRCAVEGLRYQTQVKTLMQKWLDGEFPR